MSVERGVAAVVLTVALAFAVSPVAAAVAAEGSGITRPQVPTPVSTEPAPETPAPTDAATPVPPTDEPEPVPTETGVPPTAEPTPTEEAPAPTEVPVPDEAPVDEPDNTELAPIEPAYADPDVDPVSWIIAIAVLLVGIAVLFLIRRRAPRRRVNEVMPAQAEPQTHAEPAVVLAALESSGEAMIDAGYSVVSVTEALVDIAAANGYPTAEIVVFPTALFISASADGQLRTGVVSSGHSALLLHQVEELDDAIESAQSGALPAAAVPSRIVAIRRLPRPYNTAQRLIAYMFLSSGISMLLGASWAGVLLSAVLGAVVGSLLLAGAGTARRYQALITVGASFLVGVSVFLLIRTDIDPGVLPSLIAPLIILLPGALLTTGVVELSTGQMMAGAGRLAAGSMQLILLAVGIVAAAGVVGIPAREITSAQEPLGALGPWLGVAVFGVGIVVYQCARPASLGWILLVLYVAYGAQVLADVFLGGVLSAFVGALAMTPVAVIVARQRSGPPAIVSFLPAFWLLVPGALGLVGVASLLGGDTGGVSSLVTTVSTMVAIALGVLAGTAITGRVRRGPGAI
ncbi:uncharacterized membrane protein YjjP (DUF1212 family) [Microterricola gilva]|uniref:Uncharacterized membrane protein YjjP (DUF1212 family) n=1 Tax=Microterricola gilva TaxID=393267 RepID=A0A4Q8AN04_9MICO|nr:threonine/serine exporter family protein [Microterricola gilva]RZU65335.1 uncharacterized membrane protein YjjP (DUF1212 family) [Microterricola gilva]